VTVDGFTSGAIRVLDITDEDAVREIAAKVEQTKSGYSVTVASPEASERTLLAIADEKAQRPASIVVTRPSRWRDPGSRG